MKILTHFSFVLLTLVAAVTACTRTTCPKVPVTAIFPLTNCLGEPEFIPFVRTPLNTCFRKDYSYYSYNVTSEGLEDFQGDDASCSTNLSYGKTFQYFYVCRPNSAAGYPSSMLLPSVNATYRVPQDLSVNTSYPGLSRTPVECPGATNCSLPNSILHHWTTTYNLAGEPEFADCYYNISYDGTCYAAGKVYNSFECKDEHSYIIKSYQGKGCENLFQVRTVKQILSRTRFFTEHCIAPPSPPPPITPTPPTEPVVAPVGSPASEPIPATEPVHHPMVPIPAPIGAPVDNPTPQSDSIPTPFPSPPALQPSGTPTTEAVPASPSHILLPSSALLALAITSAIFFILVSFK